MTAWHKLGYDTAGKLRVEYGIAIVPTLCAACLVGEGGSDIISLLRNGADPNTMLECSFITNTSCIEGLGRLIDSSINQSFADNQVTLYNIKKLYY